MDRRFYKLNTMGMNAIKARRTGATAKTWIEIVAHGQSIAGLIERTLVHIVAGGAVDFMATWTGDALKVRRKAQLNAFDT